MVLLQSLVVMPMILMALDRHGDPAGRVRIRRIVSLPARNPGILASVLGVVFSAVGLSVPSAVGGSLDLLAAAAVPAGLIALGASLYSADAPMKAAHLEISVITTLKLVVQPLIAFAFGLLLHLSHTQLLTVVLCAGLPTAQNTFIFAQEYGVSEAVANRAVVITTTFSLATLAAAAALLGHVH